MRRLLLQWRIWGRPEEEVGVPVPVSAWLTWGSLSIAEIRELSLPFGLTGLEHLKVSPRAMWWSERRPCSVQVCERLCCSPGMRFTARGWRLRGVSRPLRGHGCWLLIRLLAWNAGLALPRWSGREDFGYLFVNHHVFVAGAAIHGLSNYLDQVTHAPVGATAA